MHVFIEIFTKRVTFLILHLSIINEHVYLHNISVIHILNILICLDILLFFTTKHANTNRILFIEFENASRFYSKFYALK